MKKKPKECKKSLDGNHCWHSYNMYTDFKTHVTETCCWCGDTKEYDAPNIGGSWSYDSSKHGPFSPQTNIIWI